MWVSEGGGRPPGRHRARASGLTAFLGPRFSRLYPLYFFMLALDVFLGKTLFLSLLGKEDGFHDLARAALLPSIAAKLALCAVRELLTRLCDRRRRELVDQHRMVFLSRLPAAFGPGAQDTAAADHDLRTPGLVRVLGRAFLQPRGPGGDRCLRRQPLRLGGRGGLGLSGFLLPLAIVFIALFAGWRIRPGGLPRRAVLSRSPRYPADGSVRSGWAAWS
jgi:peptidoglycan/LPS O-acetylase OafA/YrhL